MERERVRVKTRIEEIRKSVSVTPPTEPGDDEGSVPEDPGSGDDTGTAPTVTFTASKSSVALGETTTLTWSTEDADRCTASGASDWQGAKATAGTGSVVVQATTTYTLACGNEHGTTTKDVTVGAYEVEDPGSGDDTGTAPTVTFTASKSSVALGETTTLTWSTEDADRCTASGASDWQGAKATAGTGSVVVQATTTYTLACGNEHGTTTKDVTVGAYEVEDPDPEPNGAVLITEVHFNPSAEAGQGNNTDNEWVELYNGTTHTVDLMGWSIRDNTHTDVLSATSFAVPSRGYVVVTRATSTDTYWQYGPNAMVIHLNSALGNGLGNGGDSLTLHNAEGVAVDALSWGVIESSVLSPVSIVGMPEGASLERIDHAVDTDTAADWKQQSTPTPGK